VNAVDRLAEAILTALARERVRLDEGLDALLEEERIARGVGDQSALELGELGCGAEDRVGERAGAVGEQRIQTDLRRRGRGHPVPAMLGPRADDDEHARVRQSRRQLLDHRVRLRVRPL